jgi:hypothetical protein
VQSVVGLLEAMSEVSFAVFVRESTWAFPAAEAAHVIAISLVVGLIAIIDLRLLGLASVGKRLTSLTRDILPWTWGAFAVAVVSGMAMFASQPLDYFNNTAFRIKILLLVLAGCNMIYFHLITCRDLDGWDSGPVTPPAAKFAGGASLTFWVAVVILGRQVGFTMY